MVVVSIVVMIAIVPIMVAVPAMSVFIPPAMIVLPARRARFGEFVAPVVSLLTLPTMMLHSFVQFVVCLGSALLAIIGARDGCARK